VSFFEGFRRGRAEAHAVISVGDGGRTLSLIQDFFRNGANWTQGAYHRANGTKCLIGAIEHLGASKAITQAQCRQWIQIAISERQPGARRPESISIEGFNDSRKSYVEVAEVIARARVLAVAHAKKMASELRLTAAQKEAPRLPPPVRAQQVAAPAHALPKVAAAPQRFALPAPPQTLALPYEVRVEPDLLRKPQPVPVAKQRPR
jgi:hypothetical protein